jgi:hypothetical protein
MMKKVLVLALVLVVSSAAFAGMSWSEDFSVEPDYSAAGDWVVGRANGAPPAVSGGSVTWDGSGPGWTLVDDRYNNPLNDKTTFAQGWEAAPAGANNAGVGLWFNFAADGNVHGYGVNIAIMLGRDGAGNQAVIMNNGAPTIVVAEGRVDMTGEFNEDTALMTWAITDSVTTHIGSYQWTPGVPANSQDAGITWVQMGNGAGSLDYITVENIPEPATLLLLSLGGLVLRKRRKA